MRLRGIVADVIQAPKLEPRIMPYELSDYEGTAMKPMLPNKPRGIRGVNDRLLSALLPQTMSLNGSWIRRGLER